MARCDQKKMIVMSFGVECGKHRVHCNFFLIPGSQDNSEIPFEQFFGLPIIFLVASDDEALDKSSDCAVVCCGIEQIYQLW